MKKKKDKQVKFNITKACRDALRIMLDLPDAAHSVEHVVRVYDWCRRLAKDYPQTDLKVLKISAYWHDVGRSQQSEDKDDHNIKSSQMIGDYLEKIKADKNFIKKVKYTVLNHSFTCRPKNIEGKILHDADKLSFTEDFQLLDPFDGFKDGYESKTFSRKHLAYALKTIFSDKEKGMSYFYDGLILPESKKILKSKEKDLKKLIKVFEKYLDNDSIQTN